MIDQVAEQAYKQRHKDTAVMYEPGGGLQDWGSLDTATRTHALKTANLLKETGIIKPPKPGQKGIIVSPSANIGIYEQLIRGAFGDNYVVVAGDLADIKRFKVKDGAREARFDAAFLPFAASTVDTIFDRAGAMWHEAFTDVKNQTDANTLRLFQEYRRALKVQGCVVIEQASTVKLPTSFLIDCVLQKHVPEGYNQPFIIGARPYQYRVYRKNT